MLQAIVSVPASGVYVVRFYFTIAGRITHQMPIIEIPCDGYKHARAVADVYNKGYTNADNT